MDAVETTEPATAAPLPPSAPAPSRAGRLRLAAGFAALGVAIALATITDMQISGQWQGVFLLRGRGTWPLVVKDDLFLGDGSRLVVGTSFSHVRRLIAPVAPARGQPWLELEWEEGQGSGLVRNHLADGTELVTVFSRYEDDDGKNPKGLFVGGALPDVSAVTKQDESGMTLHDARGWHHVWCNTNETLLDMDTGKYWPPGAWQFLGGRVLIRDPDRVVIESSHEVPLAGGPLRIDRFAYFRAGKPWFKLGIRFINAGERPLRYAYSYGDEPWVGHFGSAAGNFGWLRDRVVRVEGPIDVKANRWAGIVDEESGIADFIAWVGEVLPDRVYFANEAGSLFKKLGQPLASNEVFIGVEWLDQTLQPGASRSYLLSLGLARANPETGIPALPDGAGPP